MPKEKKTFRLNEAAIKAIPIIMKLDSRNSETAAVEIALINYAKHLKATT